MPLVTMEYTHGKEASSPYLLEKFYEEKLIFFDILNFPSPPCEMIKIEMGACIKFPIHMDILLWCEGRGRKISIPLYLAMASDITSPIYYNFKWRRKKYHLEKNSPEENREIEKLMRVDIRCTDLSSSREFCSLKEYRKMGEMYSIFSPKDFTLIASKLIWGQDPLQREGNKYLFQNEIKDILFPHEDMEKIDIRFAWKKDAFPHFTLNTSRVPVMPRRIEGIPSSLFCLKNVF